MDFTFSKSIGTNNSLDGVVSSSEDLFEDITDPQKILKHINGTLRWIMFTLQQEQRAYQEQVNHYFCELRKQFQLKISDQNQIIEDLRGTIDTLIEASKLADSEFDKIVKAKDDQIEIYKNLLRRRYIKDLEKNGKTSKITAKTTQSNISQQQSNLRKVVSSFNVSNNSQSADSQQFSKIRVTPKKSYIKCSPKVKLFKQYLGVDRASELLSAYRQSYRISSKRFELAKQSNTKLSSPNDRTDNSVMASKIQGGTKSKMGPYSRQCISPAI